MSLGALTTIGAQGRLWSQNIDKTMPDCRACVCANMLAPGHLQVVLRRAKWVPETNRKMLGDTSSAPGDLFERYDTSRRIRDTPTPSNINIASYHKPPPKVAAGETHGWSEVLERGPRPRRKSDENGHPRSTALRGSVPCARISARSDPVSLARRSRSRYGAAKSAPALEITK